MAGISGLWVYFCGVRQCALDVAYSLSDWLTHFKNPIIIYLLVSSPPTLTHPRPQNYTPKPEISTTVSHIVIIFIIFCGIRRYFVKILIVSAHGGAIALNRISHKTIFLTYPHYVSSWSSYIHKQAFRRKSFCLFILI